MRGKLLCSSILALDADSRSQEAHVIGLQENRRAWS